MPAWKHLALCVVVGTATACGGGAAAPSRSEATAAPSLNADTPAAAESTDTAEATAAPQPHSIGIDWVASPSGWTYAESFSLPAVTLTLTKDISDTPPGKARLLSDLNVDAFSTIQAQTLNPGRPNGPAASIYLESAIFPISPSLAAATGLPASFGRCGVLSKADGELQFRPYPYAAAVSCKDPTAEDSAYPDGDLNIGAEGAIDRLLARFSDKQSVLTFSISNGQDEGCAFTVNFATGVATKVKSDGTGNCKALRLQMIP